MKYIKLLVVTFIFAVMFSSCTTTNSMYYWGPVSMSDNIPRYEHAVYDYYKYQSPESICKMIETYQEIMIKCKANEKMIPPGICAEFGYILLNPENEAYFVEHATKSQKKMMEGIVFLEYGKEMIEKEVALYPEARHFLEPIIKRITNEDKED